MAGVLGFSAVSSEQRILTDDLPIVFDEWIFNGGDAGSIEPERPYTEYFRGDEEVEPIDEIRPHQRLCQPCAALHEDRLKGAAFDSTCFAELFDGGLEIQALIRFRDAENTAAAIYERFLVRR